MVNEFQLVYKSSDFKEKRDRCKTVATAVAVVVVGLIHLELMGFKINTQVDKELFFLKTP